MFSRLLGVPVLLAAAVGVPYLATQAPNLDALWNNGPAQNYTNGAISPQLTETPQGPSNPVYSTTTPLEGIRDMPLPEIFRFDINKQWVYRHWARKSTALAELGLYGIRVPLVSGTQLHDLAGSLTYYFNSNGVVERISFNGNTGDTTRLVMLLANRYGLVRQTTPIAGEQLFQTRRGAQVFSELRTRPAPVLWANSPHDNFTVELELQRPGSTTPLVAERMPLTVTEGAIAQPSQVAQVNTVSEGPTSQKSVIPVDQAAQAAEGKKKWNAFFPRSRVPKGQVESLERRDRFW